MRVREDHAERNETMKVKEIAKENIYSIAYENRDSIRYENFFFLHREAFSQQHFRIYM